MSAGNDVKFETLRRNFSPSEAIILKISRRVLSPKEGQLPWIMSSCRDVFLLGFKNRAYGSDECVVRLRGDKSLHFRNLGFVPRVTERKEAFQAVLQTPRISRGATRFEMPHVATDSLPKRIHRTVRFQHAEKRDSFALRAKLLGHLI